MAQGTPDLEQYFPAGLRPLEPRPVNGGESRTRADPKPFSQGAQARISRLRDFADVDEPSRPGPAGAAGRTRNRGDDRSEGRCREPSSPSLPRTLAVVIEAEPDGTSLETVTIWRNPTWTT